MLNQSGVSTATFGAPKQILADTTLKYSLGCVVDSTVGVTVGTKKIAKAGTPITGDLNARTTAFVAASGAEGANNAVGVLLHDVDVTNGDANGTVLIFGFINKNRLESDTQALLTGPVITALKNKVTVLTV